MAAEGLSGGRVVARLTLVNGLVAAFGLLTGPLLAHALGPEGRGMYAAVAAPLSLAPAVLGFGLPTFVTRESAMGVRPGRILGSVGPFLLLAGALGMLLAPFAADAFGRGRSAVHDPLLIGLLLTPIVLLSVVSFGLANGAQNWRIVTFARLAPAVIGLTGIAGLSLLGTLTVRNAAAVLIVGSVSGLLPAVLLLARGGRVRFESSLATKAVRFAPAAWLWQLGSLTNARLDQVLMISLSSTRQLGLYAVAVTIGGLCTTFVGAVGTVLLPRMVAGDAALLIRAFRLTVTLTVFGTLALALVTPVLLPLMFGSGFFDAVPMALILLAAGVPAAGSAVLLSALFAGGAPRWAAYGEATGLLVTVGALLLLLPLWGGMGAACTSLLSYTATLAVLTAGVARRFDVPVTALFRPSADETRQLAARGRRVLRAFLSKFPARAGR
jgi:O-antigen/teichoic acid export membrane protein